MFLTIRIGLINVDLPPPYEIKSHEMSAKVVDPFRSCHIAPYVCSALAVALSSTICALPDHTTDYAVEKTLCSSLDVDVYDSRLKKLLTDGDTSIKAELRSDPID